MRQKITSPFLALAMVAALGMGLAGCGGGGSSTAEGPATETGPTVEEQLAAEKAAREAAEKALADKEAADKAAADAAAAAAMNAAAKKLHAGLNEDFSVTTLSVTGGKLTGTVDPDGAGDAAAEDPMVLDSSGAVTPTISGWNGADYSKTVAGVTNHAVVYSNPGAPRRQRFEEKHAGIITDATGDVPQSAFGSFKIAGSAFASGSGTKTHSLPAGSTADYLSVRGTFDGASGQFRCAASATCTSAVDDVTGVSLSAGWYFIADDGAMTSTADPDYVRFGFWARDTGKTALVDVFVFPQGSPGDGTNSIDALEGSATYVGGAAGKVAVYSPLSDSNDAGAFNAAATLTAEFGNETAAGTISGSLTNFSVDGRSKDWSVALKETAIATGASTFGGTDARTSWTIGGEKAADAGMWGGTLYEVAPATRDDAGTPLTAAGTFRAEYGTVGRMVGAFGANKQ